MKDVSVIFLDDNKGLRQVWTPYLESLGLQAIHSVSKASEVHAIEGVGKHVLIENHTIGFFDLNLFVKSASAYPHVAMVELLDNCGQPLLKLNKQLELESAGILENNCKEGFAEVGITWLSSPKFNKGPTHYHPQARKKHPDDLINMKPALYLDRDGIINHDKGYVYKWEDIEFFDQTVELMINAKKKGWIIIVLTNQSGIGQELYTEIDVDQLHSRMHAELDNRGATVDGWYYCPYNIKGKGEYKYLSLSRKPWPGMALKAEADFPIDRTRSFMVGDKNSDRLHLPCLKTFLVRGQYQTDHENATIVDDVSQIFKEVFL